MLFSSISFLYYFLPTLLLIYFVVPKKFKNPVLLIGSLFFYFYGEPKYVFLLLFSSLADYINALMIDQYRGQKIAKVALIASIGINLLLLGFFKYTDFFIGNINTIFGTNLALLKLALPIGISFYTFQTMSYTIDVYRGEVEAQRNFFDFTTYVTLFPQLIAGPIVRYKTIAEEIETRTHSLENFAWGAKRFVIGLSKKVLIANSLGELNALAIGTEQNAVLFYWLGAIAFALQIYFDFSGYSDMAIGLGRIFGFHFLENFNYPYVSKSMTEFWNRWHMSLGTWFKDYVYIPLGGNRVSKAKWYRNIFMVWFLTGFWHGASWNFVVWGLYFGVLLVIEKMFLKKILDQLPAFLNHAYVLFLVLISFIIFNIDSMSGIYIYLKGMFGRSDIPIWNQESIYYLKSYAVTMIMAMIGATPLVKNISKKYRANKVGTLLAPIVYVFLLLITTGYLVDSSFNPFLYFRF